MYRPSSCTITHAPMALLPVLLVIMGQDECPCQDCDQDGWTVQAGDCDDYDPELNPGAEETCDALDNDCDGLTDEDVTPEWYLDQDGDGYGTTDSVVQRCDQPQGFAPIAGDCNDKDPEQHPGADDDCDGMDNDCDGTTDEDGGIPWYADTDGDGYGQPDTMVSSCTQPPGYSGLPDDCDDTNPAINPDAVETCDGTDNDCDGATDEQLGEVWYQDNDGDGFGVDSVTASGCQPPYGYTAADGDCDDTRPDVYPAAAETCDGLDNDCDGQTDEGFTREWRPDTDADGFGSNDTSTATCEALPGYVESRGDCDDGDASVHPGAIDTEGDGVDADCGGNDAPDSHAGLGDDSAPSIQAAIDAASPGSTVWVGPGTYLENEITMSGKPITLISTHGAEQTVIDAAGQGRVLVLDSGEGPDTTVSGFTLTGGYGERGAGLRTYATSPTLEDLVIRNNHATIDGGGVNMGKGHPVMKRCTITNNTADDQGGGLLASSSATLTLEEVTLRENVATRGGGIGAYNVTMTASQLVVEENSSVGRNIGAGQGGGIYVDSCHVTLSESRIANNVADAGGGGLFVIGAQVDVTSTLLEGNLSRSAGGGVFVQDADPSFSNCTFAGNEAATDGGAAYLENAAPIFSSCRVEGNRAERGGGLYLAASSPSLFHGDVTDNEASEAGGGLFLDTSSPSISYCRLAGNISHGNGGGAYLASSDPAIANCTFAGNDSGHNGGALFCSYSDPRVLNTVFTANAAADQGGGLFLSYSSPSLTNCTIAGNSAPLGGGVYVQNSSPGPTIGGSILVYNSAYNLFVDPSSSTVPALSFSDLFNPGAWSSHNLDELDASNATLEPGFVAYTPNGDPGDDDFHLAASSPLIDASDPETTDPDGTRADMGAYGGPGADWTWYADGDGDGLYDGFEVANGLDPTSDDAFADADHDGLLNQEEFLAATNPQVADTDGDGYTDLAELLDGADPTDFYSQPGLDAPATARVPEDFPSIQAAINAVRTTGRVDVGPGVWTENLVIQLKTVSITGRNRAVGTLLYGNGERVVRADNADLELEGFTITGGVAPMGAGIYLFQATGRLEDLVVVDNRAENGGSGYGGGILMVASDPTCDQLEVTGNSADDVGGGLYLESADPALRRCTISGNAAERAGGGIYLHLSNPAVTSSVIQENTSGSYGGGGHLDESSPTLTRVRVIGNTATYGGGLYLFRSTPVMTTCRLEDNSATNQGGALYLYDAAPTISQSGIVANEGQEGGGMFLLGRYAVPALTGSLLAYNVNGNLLNDDGSPGAATLLWSSLYNPEGWPNHDLLEVDPSVVTAEPGFMEYDALGFPSDQHIAASSPLVDTGPPGLMDADGTPSDIGVYGGLEGAEWDSDQDGYFDYFWPGTFADAPPGTSPAVYDCDDADPAVHENCTSEGE